MPCGAVRAGWSRISQAEAFEVCLVSLEDQAMFLLKRRWEIQRPKIARRRHTPRPRAGLTVEALEARLALAADLLPVLVVAPVLGSQELVMQVETQIDNLGSTRSKTYDVQYRLSLDPVIDASDRLLLTVSKPRLDAGSSETWTQELLVPADLPQGRFYVGVVVDSSGNVPEGDETNNVLVDPDRTSILPGLPLDEYDSLAAAGTPYVEGVNGRYLMIDGYPRTYVTYVPAGVLNSADPVPLVVMAHGSTGNGRQFLNISGWREKADQEGLIAVFPTGAMYHRAGAGDELSGWATKWNYFGFDGDEEFDFTDLPPEYPIATSPWPADDVGFIGEMLADLQAALPVDPQRIYATGFSVGANFAARLAVEMADTFAAAAYVGGGLTAAA